MSTSKRLRHIATLRSGYPFRSRIEEAADGNAQLIQMRDLDYHSLKVRGPLKRVDIPDLSEKFLLREGDILFSGRGTNNVAIIVENLQGPTLIPSMLYLIRVKSAVVDPHYLVWYLNQGTAQRYLQSRSIGSVMSVINKKDLAELPVPIPPLDLQVSIATTDRLLRREAELTDQLKSLRAGYIQSLLLHKAEGTTP